MCSASTADFELFSVLIAAAEGAPVCCCCCLLLLLTLVVAICDRDSDLLRDYHTADEKLQCVLSNALTVSCDTLRECRKA